MFNPADWLDYLISGLERDLGDDWRWAEVIADLKLSSGVRSVHMGVFIEPFLRYILDGSKTIESRFGSTRRVPYKSVHEGDIILLKKSGGPVCGVCKVDQVWCYELDPDSRRMIKQRYAEALCADDPNFWREKASASYVTLMAISDARSLGAMAIPKRDRRGWVMIKPGTSSQESLGL